MRKTISFLFTYLLVVSAVSAQTWVPVSDIPSGRHHPVTFALNGIGYSATGTDSTGNETKTFYQYDPAQDAWTSLTDFPGEARSFAIGVVNNGLAYLGFGRGVQYLNDLWRYDAQSAQWTQLASCPCSGRTHPALVTLDNKIYMGLGSDGQSLNDWWEYNISSDSWTQMANLPGPARHHPYQFTAGGEVFAGLGHGNGIFKDWYKLDTSSNTWTAMADFPGEARVAGTQFEHADYGYVLSGDGDDHSYMPTGEMWRYDHLADTWMQLTPHPGVSRWAPGSFVIGNEVYFFGGKNRQANTYPVSAYKFDLGPFTVGLQQDFPTEFKAFPNPFHDRLNIQTDHNGLMNYRIRNLEGKILQQGAVIEGSINTGKIGNGIFILEVQDAEQDYIVRKQLVKLGE